jgi:histidyl-tRNA synthetase
MSACKCTSRPPTLERASIAKIIRKAEQLLTLLVLPPLTVPCTLFRVDHFGPEGKYSYQVLKSSMLLCLSPASPLVVQTAAALKAQGVRVEVMERASIAKMIRTAEKAKTPVMAVVGAKEAEGGTLAVRLYGGEDVGSLPVTEVAARIHAANESRGSF